MSTTTNKPATAIGYVRVSSEQQADHGVSLAEQESAIRRYCSQQGLTLTEVVTDAAVSGARPFAKREGGARVLAAVRSGKADAVVAVRLDRIGRSAIDCLGTVGELDRRGAALRLLDFGGSDMATDTPHGKFMLTMLAGLAELERSMIRQRTRDAMQHLKATGRYTGGKAPYGYSATPDGTLVEVPAEQAVLARVREARARGCSLRAIVAELKAAALVSRTGRPFGLTQVARMAKVAA